jgi:hypothetical protein
MVTVGPTYEAFKMSNLVGFKIKMSNLTLSGDGSPRAVGTVLLRSSKQGEPSPGRQENRPLFLRRTVPQRRPWGAAGFRPE